MPRAFKLKLVIGGAKASGKSSFIDASNESDWPIGVSFKSIECYSNQHDSYKFLVWDLKDRPRFRFMFKQFCRGACAGLICFDLTDKISFLKTRFWIKLFREAAGNVPLFLIGTKADLKSYAVKDQEVKWLVSRKKLDGAYYTSIYDHEDQKKKIFKRIIELIDPKNNMVDFSIYFPNFYKDEGFRHFCDVFAICPVCKKKLHFDYLKNFYYNENIESKIIKTQIQNLINDNREFISVKKLSLGIPCCNCYQKLFVH